MRMSMEFSDKVSVNMPFFSCRFEFVSHTVHIFVYIYSDIYLHNASLCECCTVYKTYDARIFRNYPQLNVNTFVRSLRYFFPEFL